MKPEDILGYVMQNFEGLNLLYLLGEKGLFYNPGKKVPKGTCVVTIREDAKHDKVAGEKGEENWYQVSLCVSRRTFENLFGQTPEQYGEQKDTRGDTPVEVDVIMPHPEHGHLSWVAVINPGEATFKKLKPLLKEAYEMSRKKFDDAWKKKTTAIIRRPGM